MACRGEHANLGGSDRQMGIRLGDDSGSARKSRGQVVQRGEGSVKPTHGQDGQGKSISSVFSSMLWNAPLWCLDKDSLKSARSWENDKIKKALEWAKKDSKQWPVEEEGVSDVPEQGLQ